MKKYINLKQVNDILVEEIYVYPKCELKMKGMSIIVSSKYYQLLLKEQRDKTVTAIVYKGRFDELDILNSDNLCYVCHDITAFKLGRIMQDFFN